MWLQDRFHRGCRVFIFWTAVLLQGEVDIGKQHVFISFKPSSRSSFKSSLPFGWFDCGVNTPAHSSFSSLKRLWPQISQPTCYSVWSHLVNRMHDSMSPLLQPACRSIGLPVKSGPTGSISQSTAVCQCAGRLQTSQSGHSSGDGDGLTSDIKGVKNENKNEMTLIWLTRPPLKPRAKID